MIINGSLYIFDDKLKRFHFEKESINKDNVSLLKVGDIISIDVYSGVSLSYIKIISDRYIILGTGEEEKVFDKKYLCDWYKCKAYKVLWIKNLPENFDILSAEITKSIIRGWYRKGYELAEEFGLLWYLKDRCSLLVDNNLPKFLERNKVTQEEFEELIAKESDDYSKPLTVNQKNEISALKVLKG